MFAMGCIEYQVAIDELHAPHHLIVPYREFLHHLDYLVAELMVEATLDFLYLLQRLLGEALGELLAHQFPAIEARDHQIGHVGQHIKHSQRQE